MKRLMIASLITLVPIVSGCCGGLPRLSMYRGDSCNSCPTTGALPTTGIGTYNGDYDWQPSYQGQVLSAQPAPGYLPGPVVPST